MNLPTGDMGQPAAKNNQTRIIIGVVVVLVLCCCCTVVAGTVTVLLMSLRSISAVVISLWDVEPLPSKAATRLVNVEVMERSRQQKTQPRVRLLIQNPQALASLSELQSDSIGETL